MVNHHFDNYMEISRKIMNIFREYDPNMFTAGCDEGYLKCARLVFAILVDLLGLQHHGLLSDQQHRRGRVCTTDAGSCTRGDELDCQRWDRPKHGKSTVLGITHL